MGGNHGHGTKGARIEQTKKKERSSTPRRRETEGEKGGGKGGGGGGVIRWSKGPRGCPSNGPFPGRVN